LLHIAGSGGEKWFTVESKMVVVAAAAAFIMSGCFVLYSCTLFFDTSTH